MPTGKYRGWRSAHWLVMLLGVSLSACTLFSGRHFSHMDESLDTRILPNTSKQFIYRLALPNNAQPSRPQVHRSTGGRSPQVRGLIDPSEANYRRLQRNAADAVIRAGYCREGFIELDYRMAPHRLWLRGECREGASEVDIQRFGDRNSIDLDSY